MAMKLLQVALDMNQENNLLVFTNISNAIKPS